jgi:hypothetical protein
MSDIRSEIRAFSLSEAEGPDREIVRALYETFDRHNTVFWAGELHPVPILISPPTSARAFADASEFSGFGCKQQMRVRPSVARGIHNSDRQPGVKPFHRMTPEHDLEDRLRWLSDLVLHEMVHLWLNQIEHPGQHEHQGHGAAFTSECNRIGTVLGLPLVKSRRRRNDPPSLPISGQWPQNVRPGGDCGPFYGQLWEAVAAIDEPFDGFAQLCAAWEDPRVTETDRRRFMRRYGMAEVAVAIVPDAPCLVTISDDAVKRGTQAATEVVTIDHDMQAV